MNPYKINLIVWWIEHMYHFEWCLLWSGLIGWYNAEYGVIYAFVHLAWKSWKCWFKPKNRMLNLAILKHIFNL